MNQNTEDKPLSEELTQGQIAVVGAVAIVEDAIAKVTLNAFMPRWAGPLWRRFKCNNEMIEKESR